VRTALICFRPTSGIAVYPTGTPILEGVATLRTLIMALLLLPALAGCSLVAAPFHVTADVVRIVPVAGDVVAAPLDLTGDVID
jgi:hypothetical protein